MNIRSILWEPDNVPDAQQWLEWETLLKNHPAKEWKFPEHYGPECREAKTDFSAKDVQMIRLRTVTPNYYRGKLSLAHKTKE